MPLSRRPWPIQAMCAVSGVLFLAGAGALSAGTLAADDSAHRALTAGNRVDNEGPAPGPPPGLPGSGSDGGTPHPPSGEAARSVSANGVQSVTWFPGGTGLFVPPFYDTFKGIDLSPLSALQKERFLHWVNTEFCTCGHQGCRRDTIANCYTHDSTCPRAPARIRDILDRVKKGETVPGADAATVSRDASPAR